MNALLHVMEAAVVIGFLIALGAREVWRAAGSERAILLMRRTLPAAIVLGGCFTIIMSFRMYELAS